MYRNCFLLSFLFFQLLCSDLCADNWLVKTSDDRELFAVLPVRLDKTTIGGFEAKNIVLFKDGKRIGGYGFTIKKDGRTFKFDQDSIPRYYLRPTRTTFQAGRPAIKWQCDTSFFRAVIKGQKQRVDKGYSGLSHYYPNGTRFQAKYIKKIEVLGQRQIQEKMRPIEVWGLAKGKSNAEKMIKYFESQMVRSTYHYFTASPQNFHKTKRLLNDAVEVEFNAESVLTKSDKGNLIKGVRFRKADFFMDLSVNGISAKWTENVNEGRRRVRSGNYSTLKWYWGNPGWHSENLGGRYVKCYVRSQGEDSEIWVQYSGGASAEDMDIVNVRIPKCE